MLTTARMIKPGVFWVGVNDRRIELFENVFPVPRGVSYNSYLILGEKTVLVDTADKSFAGRLLENIGGVLDGRNLDYVVVNHVEPDHSAALSAVAARYPDAKIAGGAKTAEFLKQFFSPCAPAPVTGARRGRGRGRGAAADAAPGTAGAAGAAACGFDVDSRFTVFKDGEALRAGGREFRFIAAPMVHWPEVTVTYDATDKILFSADAFGAFGALPGGIFADETDFTAEYLAEARRYYCNIVGKYGASVGTLLSKTANLDIDVICPLHGPVWRKDLNFYIDKYKKWSAYEPEETAALIMYGSIYGYTEHAAELFAARLAENGITRTAVYDVSKTPPSVLVAEAFRCSHILIAAPTYNNGIFCKTRYVLNELKEHNIQNRTVSIIENGTWSPASGGLIRAFLAGMKNMTVLGETVSVKSAVKAEQAEQIAALADTFAESMKKRGA